MVNKEGYTTASPTSVLPDDGVIWNRFKFGSFGKFGFLDAGNRNVVFMEVGRKFVCGIKEAIAVELKDS